MAFAALGAAELLDATPGDLAARELLADAIDTIGPCPIDPIWPWPEQRLTYANAAIAEALIASGDLLRRDEVLVNGAHAQLIRKRETCEDLIRGEEPIVERP